MPRTQGASDIPPRKKARILAKKNIQNYTRKKIAEDEGVSVASVKKIKSETVASNVLTLVPYETRKLLERIEKARDTALDKLQIKLDTEDVAPEKLSTIFGTLYDKSRLESNQPTVITNTLTDEELAMELFRRLIEKRGWQREDAIEGIRERFPEVSLELIESSLK